MPIAPMTPEQLALLRTRIGDTGTPPAFTDDELQALWLASGGSLTGTTVAAYEAMIAKTWMMTDYTQNASQEKASQRFDHLNKMLQYWRGKLADENAAAKNQVKMARLRTSPKRNRDTPGNDPTNIELGRHHRRRY